MTDEGTEHKIWFWDGLYAEGHSTKGSTGWFCMEADVDPEHPERGGVTPEDIEKILRDDMGFTAEEIAEARTRRGEDFGLPGETADYPDFFAWYAGLLTSLDNLIRLDGTENYQHLVEGYWVEQLAPSVAARVFLADENPDDDIPEG